MGKTALAQMFRSDGAHFQKNYTLVSWGPRAWPRRAGRWPHRFSDGPKKPGELCPEAAGVTPWEVVSHKPPGRPRSGRLCHGVQLAPGQGAGRDQLVLPDLHTDSESGPRAPALGRVSWVWCLSCPPARHPGGPSDTHRVGFPPQTTGVDLVVKTVPVPDTGDSVVSGALAPRALSASAAGPRGPVSPSPSL